MLPAILKSKTQLINVNLNKNELSNEVSLSYNKSSIQKVNHVTSISIDRAVSGKYDLANTKTYTQNLVKKFDLTGNKETCIRKIFIAQREDNLYDVTVRELKVYYRKEKKHHFNKVIRFKSAIGTIEYVFELLKDQSKQKHITTNVNYLLN